MGWSRIDVHRAAERGDIPALERYLEAGGDLERRDPVYGAAPVHWASLGGKVTALSLLLDHGAALESRTGTLGTPLLWACMGGSPEVLRHLLQRGADISAMTKGKGTALHHAAAYGHVEAVEILLEKGASPQAEDDAGQRPGDSFDSQVTLDVQRVVSLTLAKAREQMSSSKRAPTMLPTGSGPGGAGQPVAMLPSSSGHWDGRDRRSPSWRNRGVHGNGRSNGHASPGGAPEERPRVQPRGLGRPMGPADPAPELAIAPAAAVRAVGGPVGSASRQGPSYSEQQGTHGRGAELQRVSPPSRLPEDAGLDDWPDGRNDATSISRGASKDASSANPGATPSERRSPRAWGVTAIQVKEQEGSEAKAKGKAKEKAKADERHFSWPSMPWSRSPPAPSPASDPPWQPITPGGKAGPSLGEVSTPEARTELIRLRQQLAGLESAANTAAERESEGRSAAREAIKDAAARAEEFGRAERAKSEKLTALVQALERRLSERDRHVLRLKEELDGKDARLRQAEQEVQALGARLAELELRNAALRGQTDGPPSANGGGSTCHPATESSATAGSMRALGVPIAPEGAPPSPAALSRTSGEVVSRGRAEMVSPSKSSVREGSGACSGRREESSPRKECNGNSGGIAGGGFSRAPYGGGGAAGGWTSGSASTVGGERSPGVVDWWRRGGWWDSVPGPPPASVPAKTPDPAEDQERLVSLYSMIARR